MEFLTKRGEVGRMNNELAEAFFRDIYATHVPAIGGDCSVCEDGSDMGYGVSYPCDYYTKAAEVLGLPIVEWVRPAPKPRTPEQIEHDKAFYRIFGPLLEHALRPPLLYEKLSEKSEGESVTFRIVP